MTTIRSAGSSPTWPRRSLTTLRTAVTTSIHARTSRWTGWGRLWTWIRSGTGWRRCFRSAWRSGPRSCRGTSSMGAAHWPRGRWAERGAPTQPWCTSVRLVQPDGDGGQALTWVPAELQPRASLLVREPAEADGAPVHRETEPPEVARTAPLAEHHRVVGKDHANDAAARSAPEGANRYAALDQLVEAGVEERFSVVGVLSPDSFERLLQRAVLGFHSLGLWPRLAQAVIPGPRLRGVVLRSVRRRPRYVTAPPNRRRDGDDQRKEHPPPVHLSSVRHPAQIGSVVSPSVTRPVTTSSVEV